VKGRDPRTRLSRPTDSAPTVLPSAAEQRGTERAFRWRRSESSVAFSEDDFRQMVDLLQRFGDEGLDQHETWRLTSRFGPVFVRITRALPGGEDERAYDRLDGLADS
jgi:hypothetical protein